MNPMALVTGASRGIGRGIAESLAALGYDLVLNYARNEAAAGEAVEACRQRAADAGREIRIELVRADLGTVEGRSGLIESARCRFPRCDLLVNNAGVAPERRVDLLELGEESVDRLLAINLKAPLFLSQSVARWMIESAGAPLAGVEAMPERVGRSIVFISSVSAYTASVQRGEYCISKAGVAMLVKLFAARLAEFGIQVFEVRPGVIATDMTAPVKGKYDAMINAGLTPIRRWGRAGDVAAAVSAIAQGLFPFSTGQVLDVDGGFHLRVL